MAARLTFPQPGENRDGLCRYAPARANAAETNSWMEIVMEGAGFCKDVIAFRCTEAITALSSAFRHFGPNFSTYPLTKSTRIRAGSTQVR